MLPDGMKGLGLVNSPKQNNIQNLLFEYISNPILQVPIESTWLEYSSYKRITTIHPPRSPQYSHNRLNIAIISFIFDIERPIRVACRGARIDYFPALLPDYISHHSVKEAQKSCSIGKLLQPRPARRRCARAIFSPKGLYLERALRKT